jgi:hypothetical protein
MVNFKTFYSYGDSMSRELLQQALDALRRVGEYGDIYRHKNTEQSPYTQIYEAIDAINVELAKPEHANPAAKHWHDLYRAKCKDFHDAQARLGAEIVALEEEIAELKEEQVEQEAVAQIRIKNGHWIETPRSIKVKSLPDGLHDLYTAPPRTEWVGLTDHDIELTFLISGFTAKNFAHAIEAKLKELNGAT